MEEIKNFLDNVRPYASNLDPNSREYLLYKKANQIYSGQLILDTQNKAQPGIPLGMEEVKDYIDKSRPYASELDKNSREYLEYETVNQIYYGNLQSRIASKLCSGDAISKEEIKDYLENSEFYKGKILTPELNRELHSYYISQVYTDMRPRSMKEIKNYLDEVRPYASKSDKNSQAYLQYKETNRIYCKQLILDTQNKAQPGIPLGMEEVKDYIDKSRPYASELDKNSREYLEYKTVNEIYYGNLQGRIASKLCSGNEISKEEIKDYLENSEFYKGKILTPELNRELHSYYRSQTENKTKNNETKNFQQR
jgi:hypothetical protein